ncbi:MAG: peroxiredoxin [Bacteroidales bacterium]|nr:peroxiredoxin [Bacteroidales bacterium]
MMLAIGDKMPRFEVLDQDGNTVRSEDFIGKGRKTIVYFYPKDNTSGCTAEACSLRDNYAALTAAGYNVVGVSKDSVKSHAGFRSKHDLPFTLLADTTTQMLQDFGAWGEKKMYGKTVLGTLRRTFIFDENGVLERIIEKVDTRNAAGQILEG